MSLQDKPPVSSQLVKKFDDIDPTFLSSADKEARPMTYAELEEVIKDYLLIADSGLIKIILATIICHNLPVDPVWLLIVAGPGGGKTELLMGLLGVDKVSLLSDQTPQTFMSGMKADKSGLLDRLPNKFILVLKDFTTILEFPPEKQSQILAQLREIYDGTYGKEFGNGESRIWHGKMCLIGGVTPIIDRRQPIHQALGERFIKYRPTPANSLAVTKRAMQNSGNEAQMREDIRNAFTSYVTSLQIPETPPEVPERFRNAIMYLAVFVARARSAVIREGTSREIVDVPEPEHPTRLVKQLINLMSALSIISGDFTEDDYQIIYKIGLDSLTSVRRLIVEHLATTDSPQTVDDIADAISHRPNTARRQLEELQCLKIVKGNSSRNAHSYELTNQTKKQLAHAKLVSEPKQLEGVDND
jgi:hypothetical protein